MLSQKYKNLQYKTIQRQILARIEAEILYNAKVCVNYTKPQRLTESQEVWHNECKCLHHPWYTAIKGNFQLSLLHFTKTKIHHCMSEKAVKNKSKWLQV